MRHATVLSAFIFLFASVAAAQPTHVKELESGAKVIENFESEEVGTLPQRWFNYKAERAVSDFSKEQRAKYKYEVMEQDGNKFLRYSGTKAMHLNFPTKKVDNINIHETPVLSWRWRVWDLPEGGNEDDDDANDTAASIYVVFDMGHVLFKKVPKSIRYTWSSSLEEGTDLSKFFGNQKIIILESGDDGLEEWKTFKRNIVEDYKRLFGDSPPKKPLAILILSDGDSTGDDAKADYDDIMLLPESK